jgi:hypothetical protein
LPQGNASSRWRSGSAESGPGDVMEDAPAACYPPVITGRDGMRLLVLGAVLALGGCGGGGTTGTNYSDAPPMAEIVGTPTPKPSASPTPEEAVAIDNAVAENAVASENAVETAEPTNVAE